MSSPDTPATPDYKGSAEATAAGSERVNTSQTFANRPNVMTPWGSQTWQPSAGVDPSTGQPVTQWQQNIKLNPEQQAALDAQTAISAARSNAAMSMMPQVVRNFGVGYGGGGYGIGGFGSDNSWQEGNSSGRAGVPQAAAPAPAPNYGGWATSGGSMVDDGRGGRVFKEFSQQNMSAGAQPVSAVTPAFGGSATQGVQPTTSASGGGITVDPNYWRAAGQGAALGFQAPLQQQRQQQLETQLSNMGLSRGSEAWRNEMRNLQDQNMRDNLQAFGAGQSEAGQLFNQALQANNQSLATQNQAFGQSLAGAGLGLQAQNQAFGQNLSAQGFNQTLRQQQIAELLQARTQPLNEMNALLSGQQVGMPQIPGAPQAGRAQGVDYMGALQGTYGAQMDAYNAANASSASNTQAGLGAAGLAAQILPKLFTFSDARLKENIAQVGELANGIKLYKYNFIGSSSTELGVIAQEVKEVMPDAVAVHPSNGYYMVDYNKVLA